MLSEAKELQVKQDEFCHSGIHDECHEICIENPCHTLHLLFCGIKTDASNIPQETRRKTPQKIIQSPTRQKDDMCYKSEKLKNKKTQRTFRQLPRDVFW